MENTKHGEVVTVFSSDNSHKSTGKHKFIKLSDDNKLMRVDQVCQLTGLSRASIYRAMKENRFPKSRKLGIRNIVFVRAEVEAWINNIIG